MRNVLLCSTLMLAVAATGHVMGQEAKEKGKKRDPVKQMITTLFKGLEPAELSDEQKKNKSDA